MCEAIVRSPIIVLGAMPNQIGIAVMSNKASMIAAISRNSINKILARFAGSELIPIEKHSVMIPNSQT